MVELAEIQKVSERVAKWYARRCWWAELDDLKQEALMTSVRALKTYTPEKGRFSSYAELAIRRQLGRWLLRQAPVSAALNKSHHLANLCRAEVPEDLPSEAVEVSLEVAHEVWAAKVRKNVTRVLRHKLPADEAIIARAVLVDGEEPRRVARREGVKIHHVYRATQNARDALWFDRQLQQLHAEQE